MNSIYVVERKIEGRKPDKTSSLRRLEFMPRTSTKTAVQEFHLWISLTCRLTVFPRCWARCRCRGDPLLATSTTWRLWAILCTIYRNRKSSHYSLRSRKNVFHIKKNCYNQQDSLRCEHYIGVVVQWKKPHWLPVLPTSQLWCSSQHSPWIPCQCCHR
jgi:hypothetical protein